MTEWISLLFWPSCFILSGTISHCPLLFPSIMLETFQHKGLIFRCHIILPFHTVHGVLVAGILEWAAISSSSGPRFVRTLYWDHPSSVGLHCLAHGLTELCKPLCHDKMMNAAMKLRDTCSSEGMPWQGCESLSVTSDSLRPHGLYSPWNPPGNHNGMGRCSFLQVIFPTQGSNPVSCTAGGFFTSWATREAKACVSVTQLYLTLWDPMDCSPPGSSVHGILQARMC